MLEIGSTPEAFTLADQDGQDVHWSDLRGQPVVVFFYPKANTPGCTREACEFRDLRPEFEKLGVRVLGVSADSVRAQSNFREKYDLTMPLLADPEHRVLEPWGVWGEKKNYGRTYQGIIRSTFLFDAEGTLRRRWEKVRVKEHASEVLAAARELVGGEA